MPLQVKRVAAVVFLNAIALASAAAEVRAAGEKTLRWKFTKGEKAQYQMTQEMVMVMSVAGQKIQTKMTQVIDANWFVESVDDDGTAEMTQTMERVRMKMGGAPGADIDYDSDAAEPPKGLVADMIVPVFKAMVKKPFQMKMSARGQVTDVKPPEGMVEALKAPALAQMGDMFSDENLKQMMGGSGLVFPVEPVKEGTAWQETMELKNAVIGTSKITKDYTYLGEEERDGRPLEKIDAKVETKFGGQENAQAKVEITDQESEGTLLFDDQAGRLVDAKVTTKMKMKVTAMGMEILQDITTTVTNTWVPPGKTPSSEEPKAKTPKNAAPKVKTPVKKK